MPDTPSTKFEEAMHGIDEAQTALKRAEQALTRLQQRLTAEPSSFAPLAQATLQLRDHLITDLETLEARLAQPASAGDVADKPAGPWPPEPDPGVSLGDTMALGGQ